MNPTTEQQAIIDNADRGKNIAITVYALQGKDVSHLLNIELLESYNGVVEKLERIQSQQFKPNWECVPEDWKDCWFSVGSDGRACYFEREPTLTVGEWHGYGNYQLATVATPYKLQRPQPPAQVEVGDEARRVMIKVNGFMVENGDKSLPWGNRHYMPSITAHDFYTYDVPKNQEMVCKYGLAYRTKEGAIARAKAMIGIDPQPPAPKVEVGQVWCYGAVECSVVIVTDTEVAIKNTCGSKLAVMDLTEFLSKFERVS